MSGFPIAPLHQYTPKKLANLTAATGAGTGWHISAPNIDLPPDEKGVDVSSLIPKIFGYLSGSQGDSYAVPIVAPVNGDTPAQIGDAGYFGPVLPRPGGVMPPFPPAHGPGTPGAGTDANLNYGQPSIKRNAAPGSLILAYTVQAAPVPVAYVVDTTSQSDPTIPPYEPWYDEVVVRTVPLPT